MIDSIDIELDMMRRHTIVTFERHDPMPGLRWSWPIGFGAFSLEWREIDHETNARLEITPALLMYRHCGEA